MKILMVNFPYAGHTIPTLPIIEKLIKDGYDITYINHERWRSTIENLGANFIPYDYYPEKPILIDNIDISSFKAIHDTVTRIIKDYDVFIKESSKYLPEYFLPSHPVQNQKYVVSYLIPAMQQSFLLPL